MEKRAIRIGEEGGRSSVPDRRGASRTIALFRPALVEGASFRSFCLVRNISPTGLMANFHARLQDDEPVTSRFSETIHVDGRIAWQRGDRVGIEFSEAEESRP